jgi:hypothetical protein
MTKVDEARERKERGEATGLRQSEIIDYVKHAKL